MSYLTGQHGIFHEPKASEISCNLMWINEITVLDIHSHEQETKKNEIRATISLYICGKY